MIDNCILLVMVSMYLSSWKICGDSIARYSEGISSYYAQMDDIDSFIRIRMERSLMDWKNMLGLVNM